MRRNFQWFTLLMLSGCMVGPDYRTPILDIPETFHYGVPEAQESLDTKWWERFEDPILTNLIVEALAKNKNVKIAAANIENALGVLIQIRSPLFPQIGYYGSYSRSRNSSNLSNLSNFSSPSSSSSANTGTSTDTNTGTNTGNSATALPFTISTPRFQTTWQVIANASWDIDIWGRVRRQLEAAQAALYASVEARKGVILSLVASVANTYIQLRSLDEQLAISIRTMESYAESVEYFTKQFKYGQSSKITLVQAETQYEIAASKIPQIKAQIIQTENALSVLLGSNPRSIPRGKTIRDLKLPPVPADLPSELLWQRPDIMQAEENLIAANAQIGAAQALYFPSISLTGFYGNVSQELSNLFSGPSTIWNFTGSITGPIFTAGAIYGQVYQAKAQQEAALQRYRLVIQQAFADVEDALSSYSMLQDQLEAQSRLVKAAGEYVRLSTLQYKGGYSPYFVVIQAQEQYFPAELSWAQTRQGLLSSLVDIYQSMGGGWVDEAETWTTPELERCTCDSYTQL